MAETLVLNGDVTVHPRDDNDLEGPVTYTDGTPRSQIEHADLITNPSAWREPTEEEEAEDFVRDALIVAAGAAGLEEGRDFPEGAGKERIAQAIKELQFLAEHPDVVETLTDAGFEAPEASTRRGRRRSRATSGATDES